MVSEFLFFAMSGIRSVLVPLLFTLIFSLSTYVAQENFLRGGKQNNATGKSGKDQDLAQLALLVEKKSAYLTCVGLFITISHVALPCQCIANVTATSVIPLNPRDYKIIGGAFVAGNSQERLVKHMFPHDLCQQGTLNPFSAGRFLVKNDFGLVGLEYRFDTVISPITRPQSSLELERNVNGYVRSSMVCTLFDINDDKNAKTIPLKLLNWKDCQKYTCEASQLKWELMPNLVYHGTICGTAAVAQCPAVRGRPLKCENSIVGFVTESFCEINNTQKVILFNRLDEGIRFIYDTLSVASKLSFTNVFPLLISVICSSSIK